MLEGSKNFWETNYKQNIAKMISICFDIFKLFCLMSSF